VTAVQWHPTEAKVATGSWDFTARIWDVTTHESVELKGHTSGVRGIAWHPSGELLATTGHDGTIRLWTKKGALVKIISTGVKGGFVGIDWHPGKPVLALGAWDNTIRVYDTSGKELSVLKNSPAKGKAVLSIKWHPGGSFFASGDYGNDEEPESVIRFWSAEGRLQKEIRGSKAEFRSLSWNRDGTRLASASETLRLWDEAGNLKYAGVSDSTLLWGVAWNKEGTRIITTGTKTTMKLWNNEALLLRTERGYFNLFETTATTRDSTRVAFGFDNGRVMILTSEGALAASIKAFHDKVLALAWTEDNTMLAASGDGSIRIWRTGNNWAETHVLKTGRTQSIAWSRDKKKLAFIINAAGPLVTWDLSTNKADTIPNPERYSFVSWNHEGSPVTSKMETDWKAGIYTFQNGGETKWHALFLNGSEIALFGKSGNLIKGDEKLLIQKGGRGTSLLK
jgi:WD40 repeat protein